MKDGLAVYTFQTSDSSIRAVVSEFPEARLIVIYLLETAGTSHSF